MEVETFVVPPLENNIFLVYNAATKEAALIDSSLGAAKVLPRLKDLGLTLKFVLNTHGHHDHMADDAPIAKETGAKVAIHEADVYRLEKNAHDPRPYMPTPPPPAKADLVLKEATVVKVGSVEIETIHTPGHTEGSVCFYVPAANVLFTGDTLMAGTFGITGAPGGSPAMMYRSLKRLYELPPDTQVLPGHGPPTHVGDESWIANLRYAAPH
ncbi:MAG: MBL fold metallo-hydrolase [Methanobacteriota archaeon]|nr:MAG: MBL fold metallo-hydrolase [Euryarchaeota archaeon]